MGKEDSKQLALQRPIMFLKRKPCFHTQHQAEKHSLVLMGPEKSASLLWYNQEPQRKINNYLLALPDEEKPRYHIDWAIRRWVMSVEYKRKKCAPSQFKEHILQKTTLVSFTLRTDLFPVQLHEP